MDRHLYERTAETTNARREAETNREFDKRGIYLTDGEKVKCKAAQMNKEVDGQLYDWTKEMQYDWMERRLGGRLVA